MRQDRAGTILCNHLRWLTVYVPLIGLGVLVVNKALFLGVFVRCLQSAWESMGQVKRSTLTLTRPTASIPQRAQEWGIPHYSVRVSISYLMLVWLISPGLTAAFTSLPCSQAFQLRLKHISILLGLHPASADGGTPPPSLKQPFQSTLLLYPCWFCISPKI